MTTLKFKCILHSDIVLSELAATEGIQRTLDYIPGNVFLGLVAGKIYTDIKPELAMDIFHNAKVRFGDAFPLIDGKRAIKVPASWYVKKGETLKDQIYIYHQLSEEQKRLEPMVQLRDKFIVNEKDTQFSEIKLGKNFAIKSAYDSDTRRSKDQNMYGYQSLEAGMELCFQVDLVDLSEEETSNVKKMITESLTGKRNIGRSKTAQYGQVEIFDDAEFEIGFIETQNIEANFTFLYTESRLLFIDEENGQPIIPTDGKYYGMEGSKVDLDRSQIRTFRYAPYNFKRQSRDADRFGIEKGSVICISKKITPEEQTQIKKGLGLFLNEGFGKVLINPEFLSCTDDLGKATFSFDKERKGTATTRNEKTPSSLPLDNAVLNYLETSKKQKTNEKIVYEKVNLFIEKNHDAFKGESFSSQWGTIRSIATRSKNHEELKNMLFSPPDGYLIHGVAKDKWSERGRLESLKSFINSIEPKVLASEAVVNLAAEMAKKCRRK